MDWANEPYVRLYKNETADDIELSWEALALWRAMLIRFDRSGIIKVKNGWASLARLVRMPTDLVQQIGPELVRDGRVRMIEGAIHAPNFIEAQTTNKSDKARQKESREWRRAKALASPSVEAVDSTQQCHAKSHDVTRSHTASQDVTLSSAQLDTMLIPPVKPAATKPPAVRAEHKARLPDDWQPDRSKANLAAEATARRRGVSVEVELEKLRDWARGSGERKADWNATWRNWTRNARVTGPGQAQATVKTPKQREETVHPLMALIAKADDAA